MNEDVRPTLEAAGLAENGLGFLAQLFRAGPQHVLRHIEARSRGVIGECLVLALSDICSVLLLLSPGDCVSITPSSFVRNDSLERSRAIGHYGRSGGAIRCGGGVTGRPWWAPQPRPAPGTRDAKLRGAKAHGTGLPCRGLAMKNGRCQHHGGKTLGTGRRGVERGSSGSAHG
jgi:hypothetical protein